MSTVPPGGSYMSDLSGSSYVYTMTGGSSMPAGGNAGGGSAMLCRTCGLTPTVITGAPSGGGGGSMPSGGVGDGSITRGMCTRRPGHGTTVLTTTHTITSCIPNVCPASGYIIGGTPGQGGATIVTTTDNHGHTVTYTQIRTGSGGSGGNGGGSGGGPIQTGLPTCPSSDNSQFVSPMGMIYQIECSTYFTDDSLDMQTQDSLASCVTSCDMYNIMSFMISSPCLGVSWYSNRKDENCELKAGSTGIRQRGVDSARLATPYTPPGGGGNGTGPGNGGNWNGGSGITTASPALTTVVTGGSTYVTGGSTVVVGGSTVLSTIVDGGSTVVSTIFSGGTTTVVGGSTYVSGGSTVVQTITVGGGGSGGNGGNGGGSGNGGGGNGGVGTGPGTGLVPTTEYITRTVYSTIVSNGVTQTTAVGVSTGVSIIYVPAPTQTVAGDGPPGNGPGNGPGTGPGTGYGTEVSLVPYTEYAVSTLVSTYVSNGVSYVTSYGVTRLVSIVYLPASTTTVTTTTVSVSVSNQISTVTGPTVTASAQEITITAGPGQYITVTAPATTVVSYVFPSSSKSSFTCRTYATNYLNGRGRRTNKRSVFDVDEPFAMGEMARPKPGAVPQP
ncbi:uncharacterized protein LTR77_003870 [Saxophila tyrrhenica]|uniref:Apple domain-containing protein n=1 Tax=Saxophila tyrrhenica TaxID=1690608 RepID=A0AAV9PJ54_9PEZI|nr:hypothetical protein LTR77_003870 [Saxophila tyrrhenica]